MCVGSSPVTSEMMSAMTGAREAAARRPPWIAERCLRTVFISWIAAPLRSRSRVTALSSSMGTSGAGSESRLEPPPESKARRRSFSFRSRTRVRISRAAVSPAASGTGCPASTTRPFRVGSPPRLQAPWRPPPCLRRRQTCGRAAATAGAARESAAGRPPRPRHGSCPRATLASGGREVELRGIGPEVEVFRISLAERAPDLVGGHVVVAAAVAHVLHVPAVVLVERMEQGIGPAVELERLDAEPRAKGQIEGRRRLDPLPIEQKLGVAMEHEEIGPHLRGELGRRDVILDVGVADPRRNAHRARARREQRRLGHAPAAALLDAHGCAVGVVEGEVLEGVVADPVAYRVIERHRFFACITPSRVLLRKGNYCGVIAIHEAPGIEMLVHWWSFMSLRSPAKSGLACSASPSSTEKWCVPGIGMSPAKAARQRSPMRAFWRWNSLDSSPPTQVMTGQRVAGVISAGETRAADASSRRRSGCRKSTSTSGRRS